MPNTKNLSLTINNQQVDIGGIDEDLGFRINYTLEEPENFMSKQGADPQDITLPASKKNDKIFNTFHNPKVEDNFLDGFIISASVSNFGGRNYVVGDTFSLNNGETLAICQVLTVHSGGVLLTFSIINNGSGYSQGQVCEITNITGVGLDANVIINDVGTFSYRELMPCIFSVNSIPLSIGYALLKESYSTDKPESYDISIYSENGQWALDLQNYTLWDCVSKTSHIFDLATVQASWSNFNSDEDHDYVYAPVRYSQPFDGTTLGYAGDNCVNIYHLRPSISAYWLIIRAFRQIGYTVNSQFFTTKYFQSIVLPWVWGDFYDLNSQLVEGVGFKAAGNLPTPSEAPPLQATNVPFWSGLTTGTTNGSVGGSSWWNVGSAAGGWSPGSYNPSLGPASLTNGINPTGGAYVFNGSGTTSGGLDNFNMKLNNPPEGYDNFGLYSFDPSTGTMIYNFNPPSSLVPYSNITATFVISLYAIIHNNTLAESLIALECTHLNSGGGLVALTCQSIMPTGGAIVGSNDYPSGNGYPVTPTVSNFNIPNINPGDQLKFRIRCLTGGTGVTGNFGIFSGGYLNNNPAVLGVPSYTYNPVTQTYDYITPNSIWTPLYSSLSMTGFLVQLGNPIEFQNYDAFRNFNFLDFLGGLIDEFNLEVQSDNVSKIVIIEPFLGGKLPTKDAFGANEKYEGYFKLDKILDWTNKIDISNGKGKKMSLYNDTQRQLDLTFKLDSNDGSQNIWGQRYKGIYLSNRTYTGSINQNNIDIDNGIIAAIPGSSRYMLPNRFAKGNRQMQNRFFSSTMHCIFPQWKNITGSGSPSPQLICMFPSSGNGGEGAITQSYTPKLAWYAGNSRARNDTGGWIFIGDPASPYNVSDASSFRLPLMFGVNYGINGTGDPVLSYSDENIGGTQVNGLTSQFYLERFAIMRNGQLFSAYINLNLNEITNWTHREAILIDGSLYLLIQINDYNPLVEDSTQCIFWKVYNAQQTDLNNTFPSSNAILNNPITLGQFDLKYAQLMIYPTDLPQIL